MTFTVERRIAFSKKTETLEFPDFEVALAAHRIWQKDPLTHYSHFRSADWSFNETWTAPRFLDLREFGGELGADNERMNAYMLAEAKKVRRSQC